MQPQPLLGIASLLVGLVVFSLQDVIVKQLSGAYSVHQILAVRSLVALPLFLLLVRIEAGSLRALTSPRWPVMVVRGVAMFAAYTSYYLGLAALPIATCVALWFTAPLFITLLSIPVLGERVGGGRLLAVLAGFLGMLIMVRPGAALFDWAALLPVDAGLAYAASQLMSRWLGTVERASVQGFYGNCAFLTGALVAAALFGSGSFAGEHHQSLAFLLRPWIWPDGRDLALMASCGLIALAGLTLLTQAYRVAPATTVAPFEYTALVWGTLNGWLFWRELPGLPTWLGGAIVLGAGLYVLARERRRLPASSRTKEEAGL